MKLGQKFKSPNEALKHFRELDVVESVTGVAVDESNYSPVPIKIVKVPTPPSVSSGTADEYSQGCSISGGSLDPVEPESPCDSDIFLVDVIWAGDLCTYTIPSFSVLTVELRHVEIAFTSYDGYKKVDAFMREDSDIINKVPRSLEITKECKVNVSLLIYNHAPINKNVHNECSLCIYICYFITQSPTAVGVRQIDRYI